MNSKVILIEPVLAHYRKDVFESFYNSSDVNFEIIAGNSYQGVKGIESEIGKCFDFLTVTIFKHKFYYLKGSIKYILKQNPKIIICTGVDFHLIHTTLIFIIFRVILRKKFYWWSHATYGNQGRIGIFLRKIIYKASTGIFSYNQQGRKNLLSMGVQEANIKVVNNSINKEDYGYLNHDIFNKDANKDFTILYSGRINQAKKVSLLIKALAILKEKRIDFRCNIIGDGETDEISRLVETYKLESQVKLVGAKYGKEAHELFLSADLFVYPSGIGLSVLHALSFGLPVVTTDNLNDHFPEFELLEPGINGDLFEDNSEKDLADKIIMWEDRLKNSKENYAKNCIERIEMMEYLPDNMSDKVINFLKPVKNE